MQSASALERIFRSTFNNDIIINAEKQKNK